MGPRFTRIQQAATACTGFRQTERCQSNTCSQLQGVNRTQTDRQTIAFIASDSRPQQTNILQFKHTTSQELSWKLCRSQFQGVNRTHAVKHNDKQVQLKSNMQASFFFSRPTVILNPDTRTKIHAWHDALAVLLKQCSSIGTFASCHGLCISFRESLDELCLRMQ